jgi:hypothetical protein
MATRRIISPVWIAATTKIGVVLRMVLAAGR